MHCHEKGQYFNANLLYSNIIEETIKNKTFFLQLQFLESKQRNSENGTVKSVYLCVVFGSRDFVTILDWLMKYFSELVAFTLSHNSSPCLFFIFCFVVHFLLTLTSWSPLYTISFHNALLKIKKTN